jgi:hypothetical protein
LIKPDISAISHQLFANNLSSDTVDKFQAFELRELAEAMARHLAKMRDPLQHYGVLRLICC